MASGPPPSNGKRSLGERLPWPLSALRERGRWMLDTAEQARVQALGARTELAQHQRELDARLDDLAEVQRRAFEAVRVVADREPSQRERLRDLRESADYPLAFDNDDPLVSIVIPTFDNHEMLRERALPSALGQTHTNVEVIVIGDQAPAQAREVVESFGDDRLSFHNLAMRGPYPEDARQRWLVAGVPPFNEGVRRARGLWIAPLDDDDVFHPDHVERLLAHARAERAELAYGAMRQVRPGGVHDRIGDYPPRFGQFALQAAIYHAGLGRIFELELADAVFDDPYDWALCRRMLRAGVRVSMLDEEVVDYFPSRHWTPRWDTRGADGEPGPAAEPKRSEEESMAARPEWELAEEGWEAARSAERSSGTGWDVGAVADAYRRKWPGFIRAIDGPGPLGVPHEVPEGVEIPRDDPLAHNIVMSYAHALGVVAAGSRTLSMLDWGGSTGHYYELARRLIDCELDYTVKELPAVCEIGRELVPEISFDDTEACLERSYDLVLASGSLQYEDDWKLRLTQLAAVAAPWMLVTRMPVVETYPSYPARQRAYAYGYETEYVGWVLHRGELLAATEASGFELVREYALVGPMAVAGAPENPRHSGFLLRRTGA